MDTKSKEKPEIDSEGDKVETLSDFSDSTNVDSEISPSIPLDENLTTLQKIHAILLNCINLSQKEKLEFANSQRYFMKLYLQKLKEKLKK
ncbi:MAG: hypothetical protein ACFFEN_08595 [Candidatus Thorarchaeota archaeon]